MQKKKKITTVLSSLLLLSVFFRQYHSSAAVTNKAMPLQCRTGSAGYLCHRQVFQVFVPVPFIFLHFTEIFLLPLSENKGVAVEESPASFHGIRLPWQRCLCRHSRVPAATVTISHGQGTAFAALGKAGMHFDVT